MHASMGKGDDSDGFPVIDRIDGMLLRSIRVSPVTSVTAREGKVTR
jgi:hypothetical protein